MQKILDQVGQNVAAHRKLQGISQQDLASKSGMPRSTIAGLEAGSANPTLKNLLLLCTALQISLQEMITTPRRGVNFVPMQEIESISKAKGAVVIRKMLPDPIPGMEIDFVTLRPNTRMKGVPHSKGSKEYTICTKGEISVYVEGESYSCRPGDCLAFYGDQAHSYFNPTKTLAEFVGVVVIAPIGV
jgi:XRE family transcriptional regulator, regulator of sulfur utilization